MRLVTCALALLSGVIGAGFASGRELSHFFAAHGAFAPLAIALTCLTLLTLFCRLPAQMERAGAPSLTALCRARFGMRFGRLCAALFALLAAVTGGAMLAACAELAALLLPVHHAYGIGLALSLLAGTALAAKGLSGLALPGAALCVLLPVLLLRILLLPAGEAGFLPGGNPFEAAAQGIVYGALNAAMLAGALPPLLALDTRTRRRAVLLFTGLFSAMLTLGVLALLRHRQAAFSQALPFVALSARLGKGGYVLCALSLYFAALSTLCAMLLALMRTLPFAHGAVPAALCCLLFAVAGFGTLVTRGYPVLGALCTALLGLLCLPLYTASMSRR